MTQAAASCAATGTKLTDIRRDVFRIVLENEGSIGAYAVLDRLKAIRHNAVPPTVYRALDFLLEHGLVHRVERLNAFVPCEEGVGHDHAVQFLICRNCGGVDEVEDKGVAKALRHVTHAAGFKPAHATVEVEGTCAACTANDA